MNNPRADHAEPTHVAMPMSAPSSPASPITTTKLASPFHTLQRAIGNRAVSQLLQSHSPQSRPIPQSGPVMQRMITFTNNVGTTVDVEEEMIVQKAEQWMINLLKNDDTTWPPVKSEELFKESGALNWSNNFPGGYERKASNVADYYRILKEMKQTPASLLRLEHDPTLPNTFSQMASSVLLNTKSNVDSGLMDGVIRPPDNLSSNVMGTGVSYLELHETWEKLANVELPGGSSEKRGDCRVAQAHLALLQGQHLTGYNTDEIMKMQYHLSIFQIAEPRRNAGMFVFGPIVLQNIADGSLTAKDAFFREKKEKKKEKNKGEKKGKKKGEKKAIENDLAFPAAFGGSKGPLEDIESHFDKGNLIDQYPMNLTSAQSVLKKMKKHVELYFAATDRRDFRSAENQHVIGADFTTPEGALEAIINKWKAKYFDSVPAMHDSVTDVVGSERARGREELQMNHHVIDSLRSVTDETQKFTNIKTFDVFKGGLAGYSEKAVKLTTGTEDEQRRHQHAHNATEKLAQILSNSKHPINSVDSEDEYGEGLERIEENRARKHRKVELVDALGQGHIVAEEGLVPKEDQFTETLLQKEYNKGVDERKKALIEQGISDGMKNKVDADRATKKHYKEGLEEGQKLRTDTIKWAKTCKQANPLYAPAFDTYPDYIQDNPYLSHLATKTWYETL